jgi:hypothetical protein
MHLRSVSQHRALQQAYEHEDANQGERDPERPEIIGLHGPETRFRLFDGLEFVQ